MGEVLDDFIEDGLEEREKASEEAWKIFEETQNDLKSIRVQIEKGESDIEFWRGKRVFLENLVIALLDEYGTLANLQDLIPEHRQSLFDALEATGVEDTDTAKWKNDLGIGDTPGGVLDAGLEEALDSILGVKQVEVFVPSEKDLQFAVDRAEAANENLTAAEEAFNVYRSNPVAALEATGVVTADMLPRSERERFNAEVERGFETPAPPSTSPRAVSSVDVGRKRQRAAEKRDRQPADPEAEARRILAEARVQRRADVNAAAREGQRVEGGTMDPGQRRDALGSSPTEMPQPTTPSQMFSDEELVALQTNYNWGVNTGEQGLRLQLLQQALGILPDGSYGPQTRAAQISAIERVGLEPTSTPVSLEPTTPVSSFALDDTRDPRYRPTVQLTGPIQKSGQETVTENNVLALQQTLIEKGFNPGEPDGVWGSQTAAAVRAFQESAGLSVDGVVGANTAAALGVDPVAESFPTGGTSATSVTTGDAVETTETFGDEDIRDIAAQNGYGARWFAHPEIGPILNKAVTEGWFDSDTGIRRLEAEIRQTDWYQVHTAASREFEVLEGNDPATAGEFISDQVLRIQVAANRIGLTLSDERMREMGRDAHIEKWSEYELNQFVVLEADWEAGFAGGAVEDNYSVIDNIAGNYMVGHLIDDETKDEWATGLYLGDATQAGITNDIAALAESAFPSLTARIQQGYTARQILNPLAMEVSRLLPSIDYRSVDFMTDPRFQPIIHHVQEDGSERIMTVAEVGKYVRGLEDWQTTDAAKSSAQEFADFIGKKFGSVG